MPATESASSNAFVFPWIAYTRSANNKVALDVLLGQLDSERLVRIEEGTQDVVTRIVEMCARSRLSGYHS